MEEVYIYYLSSSSNPEDIRYVGKTKYKNLRLKQHLSNSKFSKKKTYRDYWINSEINQGNEIIFNIIENTTSDLWKEKEKYWIKYYKELGFKLCNLTEGGETSNIGGEKHPHYNKIGANNHNYKGKDYKECYTNSNKKVYGNCKAVDMIDTETNEILKTFISCNEAAKFIKGNKNNISLVCRKKRKTYQGYKWQFSDKKFKPIKQYLDNKLINEFTSAKEASLQTNIDMSNICRSIRSNLKAGGYKWIADVNI